MGCEVDNANSASGVVSVVIPVFRNRDTLYQTFESILAVRNKAFPQFEFEVVFVDDGSDDGSWEELQRLYAEYPHQVNLVKLSRNFGQVSAILAGYEVARGDVVITISADLQDPVELMADMVAHWQQGAEVVIANREARNDDVAATFFSKIAYGIARRANPRIPIGGFDYLLLSRRAAKLLCSFEGRHRFFQGDVLWLGFPTTFIPYVRQRRPVGRSSWTFTKKFKYFTDLIVDSSYLPIRLMSSLGFLIAAAGMVYALIIVWVWFNQQTPFPGWAPLMVTLLLVGGLIMMMLGMIGEYLWRIYDDVKRKPLYIIENSISPVSSQGSPQATTTVVSHQVQPKSQSAILTSFPPFKAEGEAGGIEVANPSTTLQPGPPSEGKGDFAWRNIMTNQDKEEIGALKLKNVETWALRVVAFALVAFFGVFYAQTTVLRHLDTVFLLESVASIVKTGSPVSETVASWPDAIKTFTMPPEQICSMPLEKPTSSGYNVLHNHAYLAIYPIGLLSLLIGPEPALALLNALAHLALVLLPYVFLRREGIRILPSSIFALCVACYPGWSLSASGDYYLDRLYMPFALGLLYLLHSRVQSGQPPAGARWLVLVVVAALTAGSITERGAIMVIAALVFFLFAFPTLRQDPMSKWKLVALPTCLAAYLALYLIFFYQGIESGGSLTSNLNLTLGGLAQKFKHPGFWPFVLTNVLFIGWLVAFSGWRYGLLLLGAILPNLLIVHGGGELNGWLTHYHTMYIPFLVFTASVGYVELIRKVRSPGFKTVVTIVVGLNAVILAGYFNPYTGEFGKQVRGGIIGTVFSYFVTPERSGERATAQWLRSLDAMIPGNARISVVEGAMPALYKSRKLSYYPLGMDEADYLVVSGTASAGAPTSVSGAISYLGPVASKELNACLSKRAESQGFVLFKNVSPVGILVFKRITGDSPPQ